MTADGFGLFAYPFCRGRLMNEQSAHAEKQRFCSCRVLRRKALLGPVRRLGGIPASLTRRPCKPNMGLLRKKIFSFQAASVCSENCSGKQFSEIHLCILAYLQIDQNNVHDVILAFAKKICRNYITIFGEKPKPPYGGKLRKKRRRPAQ